MAACGILNLGACLPQAFFGFFASMLNAPIQPILNLTKDLLSEPINLALFGSLWAIIIYVLSMFYGFLIIYSGFNFIISGYDAAKRENAKSWLRNILIMIILIQSSFFIYELAIDLSSIMTSTVLNLVDPNFFLITIDNVGSLILGIIFGVIYITVLLITSLLLIIRYALVGIGVVFFPIGIFLYFIPPLKSYGYLIINILGVAIFITFIDAITLIGFSKLIGIPILQNYSTLIAIAGFGVINIIMILMAFFVIFKSGAGGMIGKVETIISKAL